MSDEERTYMPLASSAMTRADFDRTVWLCHRGCGAQVHPDPVEITVLGDAVPTYLPGSADCPTRGCGTTCKTCRRPPGDVHGPHCGDRMVLKADRPHIVDRSDL